MVRILVGACLCMGLLAATSPEAKANPSSSNSRTLSGFSEIYVWTSMVNPTNITYFIPAGQFNRTVPFKSEHEGRATTAGSLGTARTLTVKGYLSDRVRPAGTPSALATLTTTLSFASGYNGTKSTGILDLNPGAQTRIQGLYEAECGTSLADAGSITPDVECSVAVEYSVSF